MKWQDIITTPLFWIFSAIGSIILSVIANLLTPRIRASITRRLQSRQSGVREKQIKRRKAVLTLQGNIHRRTATKLDRIFKVLAAMTLLLLCLFLFQLTSGFSQSDVGGWSLRWLSASASLVILLAVIVAVVVLKLGLDDMSLALTADKRERASDEFLKTHEPESVVKMKQFEDTWDLGEFGVNSQNLS